MTFTQNWVLRQEYLKIGETPSPKMSRLPKPYCFCSVDVRFRVEVCRCQLEQAQPWIADDGQLAESSCKIYAISVYFGFAAHLLLGRIKSYINVGSIFSTCKYLVSCSAVLFVAEQLELSTRLWDRKRKVSLLVWRNATFQSVSYEDALLFSSWFGFSIGLFVIWKAHCIHHKLAVSNWVGWRKLITNQSIKFFSAEIN